MKRSSLTVTKDTKKPKVDDAPADALAHPTINKILEISADPKTDPANVGQIKEVLVAAHALPADELSCIKTSNIAFPNRSTKFLIG